MQKSDCMFMGFIAGCLIAGSVNYILRPSKEKSPPLPTPSTESMIVRESLEWHWKTSEKSHLTTTVGCEACKPLLARFAEIAIGDTRRSERIRESNEAIEKVKQRLKELIASDFLTDEGKKGMVDAVLNGIKLEDQ